MKTIQSGAQFWDPSEGEVLRGIFGKAVIREKDGQGENQKKGDVMGYEIIKHDESTVILGNSAAIKKLVDEGTIKENDILQISYLGKGENAKNQPFNRYKIEQFDSREEWDSVEKPS